MRWAAFSFLLICLLPMAVFADDTPPKAPTTEPASPKALVANRKFALAVRTAKEAYHKAMLAADQQYVIGLDAALRQAMLDQDIVLVRALDTQKQEAEAALQREQLNAPAGRPTPIDFTWKRVDCPAPMISPHLALYGDKLYLLGGTLDGVNGSDAIWTYNLQSGVWTPSNAALPYAVWSLEPPLVVGNQVLISPGFGPTRNNASGQHNRLIGYDFATEQTGEGAAYPQQQAIWGLALASVVVDGKPRIYSFGGWNPAGGVKTICRYDPQLDSLSPLGSATLNCGRHVLAFASDHQGRVALFGASSLAGDSRIVEVFDANSETVTTLGPILPPEIREWGCNFAWCDGDGQFFVVHFDQDCAKACQFDLDTRALSQATFSLPPRRLKTSDCRCTYDVATGCFYYFESKFENGQVTSDLWIGTPNE